MKIDWQGAIDSHDAKPRPWNITPKVWQATRDALVAKRDEEQAHE